VVRRTYVVINIIIIFVSLISKSLEDIDCFIEEFEIIAMVKRWEDMEKTIILPSYLTDSAKSVVNILKI